TRDAQAELESPDPGDFDWLVVGIADRAKELARVEVECIDRAVAEVADKKRVVEVAEALEGRPGHPPWRVELALAGEPLQQISIRVENVDKPVSRSRYIILLIGVLLSIGHVQMAVDGRNAEGGVTGREVRIPETAGSGDRMEVRVEDVDRAGMEIGGEKKG